MRFRGVGLVAFLLIACVATPACRRRRGFVPVRHARVVIPPLFERDVTDRNERVRPGEWLARSTMLAPFVTAVDGMAAAIEPAGHLRWVSARGAGAPRVRETDTPCRYDPSRHATYWTLSPRLALDGLGHVCCVHDGDDRLPSGAYCADLRQASPRFVRAHMPEAARGVGSGDGAIALITRDVSCTEDGGRTMRDTYRGDDGQPITMASCARGGIVVAVGGARSYGAIRMQTLRAGSPTTGLPLVNDAPRGEPIDVRARADGSVHALLAHIDGARYVRRSADGQLQTLELQSNPGRTIGAWGPNIQVLAPAGRLMAFGGPHGDRTRFTEIELATSLGGATRVGRTLVGVSRSGGFVLLPRE